MRFAIYFNRNYQNGSDKVLAKTESILIITEINT